MAPSTTEPTDRCSRSRRPMADYDGRDVPAIIPRVIERLLRDDLSPE